MSKDALGLPLDAKGNYHHPNPRAIGNREWVKPASFLKLRKADFILMAVPGGWDKVELPEEYSKLNGKEKPPKLHVVWKGSRLPVPLTALRIPQAQRKQEKKGDGWFYGA